ncbi:NTP transferase domain-containing protein [Nonomuraea ferruginea]
MSDQRVCAVIPAAGSGTRLGLGIPKIMLEIADGVTVWHLLHRRLSPWVEHVHVVVSPAGEIPFRRLAAEEIERGAVSVSVQARPTGMGDAIFGAVAHWEGYDRILVVWGDQVNLSPATVRQVVRACHDGLTLPLVPMPAPYVEYELDGPSPGQGADVPRGGRLPSPAGSATSASSASARTGWRRRGRATCSTPPPRCGHR